jgi:exportin-5
LGKETSTYNADAPKTQILRTFCISNTPVLSALLLFATHAIRFRDSRCCGVVLRVFRSLIPEFARPQTSASSTSSSTAAVIQDTAPIREFISGEVLKACITSLHEPYFVDLQKDLAQVIASILTYYSPLTDTPKQILISLPGITEEAASKCIDYVGRAGMQQRQQRTMILELLRDLKGVSISEMGKISGSKAKERSKMLEQFMQAPQEKREQSSLGRAKTPDMEGISGLFEG